MARALRVTAGMSVPAALALLVSGCSLLGGGETPDPVIVQTEEPAEVDEVIDALAPLLGDESSTPNSAAVFETLMDAGYEADQLEATQDDTPLENGVPSKQFAVQVDPGCVVGEIREGRAMARLLPPSDSTGTCLFGNVDRPEGAPEPSGEPRGEDDDDNGGGHIPGESFSTEDAGDGGDSGGSSDGAGDGETGGDAGLGGN